MWNISLALSPQVVAKRMLISIFHGGRFLSSHSEGIKRNENLQHSYTPSELKFILNIVNCASVKELTALKLDKQSAASLIVHRQQQGSYNSVLELLKVDGLTASNLRKFCDLVIQGSVKKCLLKQVCTPPILDEARNRMQNIVAMKVTTQHLIWAQVNRELQVINWERSPLREDVKWHTPSTIFEMVHNVVCHLPKSDAYVMEQMPTQIKQPSSAMALATTAAIQATLTSLLNYDFSSSQTHRVFTMKPNTLNNHFNIGVGNERVSCLDLISHLLDSNHSHNLESTPAMKAITKAEKLDIPEFLIMNYLKEKAPAKDEMGTALLLALVFYDLVLCNK